MEGGEVSNYSKFNPKKYDRKKVTWKNKLFIKDTTFSLFHIPLNLEKTIEKSVRKLKDSNAALKEIMVLVDENSAFHSNVYVNSKKAIKGIKDVKVSGTFLTRVFRGSYKNRKKWIKEMEEYVRLEGQEIKQMYFYYVPCPKLEGKVEDSYLVIFAEI